MFSVLHLYIFSFFLLDNNYVIIFTVVVCIKIFREYSWLLQGRLENQLYSMSELEEPVVYLSDTFPLLVDDESLLLLLGPPYGCCGAVWFGTLLLSCTAWKNSCRAAYPLLAVRCSGWFSHPGERFCRQIGHVPCSSNHGQMHGSWYTCWHGSLRTFSFNTKSSQQTEHWVFASTCSWVTPTVGIWSIASFGNGGGPK